MSGYAPAYRQPIHRKTAVAPSVKAQSNSAERRETLHARAFRSVNWSCVCGWFPRIRRSDDFAVHHRQTFIRGRPAVKPVRDDTSSVSPSGTALATPRHRLEVGARLLRLLGVPEKHGSARAVSRAFARSL